MPLNMPLNTGFERVKVGTLQALQRLFSPMFSTLSKAALNSPFHAVCAENSHWICRAWPWGSVAKHETRPDLF
jgi:hypothetical protein